MKKEKVLIIGAGLSGLYTALLLQETYDVIVVEARERTGGRVFSLGGHDMGPSWVWRHQKHILGLIKSLGLELFEQYTKGLALYDAPNGVEKFNAPPSAPSYRIKGGIIAIIQALEARLTIPIKLGEAVERLTEIADQIEVQTTKGVYLADKVISTLPPRLAVESLNYLPALPDDMSRKLQNIPTWMGYSAKCVIAYPQAFWKEEGLSGFTFSHLGPLGEIHDASTEDKAALFGFVHSYAQYEGIKEQIISQLTRLYGDVASSPQNFYIVDWKKERYTSTALDAQPLQEHPSYGFHVTHFSNKMMFSGTESEESEGGYLEGAVYAALKVEEFLA